MSVTRNTLFSIAAVIVISTVPVFADSGAGITAITNPSADVTLSFIQLGRIAKINVDDGDSVKAGQILVQQDDTVELARLAQLEAESQNLVNILAGEASLSQKRVDLKKLEMAASLKAATELEVEHAKLDVRIAELSVELARFEYGQAQRKYDEAKKQIDNMTMRSPVDGKIEKVEVETGESVNALESVIRVVKINPLWIDVPVPLVQAMSLREGNTAQVCFPVPQEISADGVIVFIGSVADAASDTLKVRVEVPNPSLRPAGEHVRVVFPTSRGKGEVRK